MGASGPCRTHFLRGRFFRCCSHAEIALVSFSIRSSDPTRCTLAPPQRTPPRPRLFARCIAFHLACFPTPPGPKKHMYLVQARSAAHSHRVSLRHLHDPITLTTGGLKNARQEHGTARRQLHRYDYTPDFCLSHTECPLCEPEHPIDGPKSTASPAVMPCHPPAAGGLLRSPETGQRFVPRHPTKP